MALATDLRPKTFDEVWGNKQTVAMLKSIVSRDRSKIQHAFLFHGDSGCGKTTMGRILASELGCDITLDDYCEVDSAQFTGIGMVREIRERMQYRPLAGECRVWLIDECHQLSSDAMNGLLKALEDTPPHVYFILCTTDPGKLLATIRGRCATFDVAPLYDDEMMDFLKTTVRSVRKRVPADVLKQITRDSLGSCRNALQVLDKIIDLPEDEMKSAAEKTAACENAVIDLCRSLMAREKWDKIRKILNGLEKEGIERIRLAVMGYCSKILLGTSSAEDSNASAAFLVMDCFKTPFYNNGRAGLVLACYEALTA